MEQIKFVKYNRTRKEEFQIKTVILEENGVTWVEKQALTEKGRAHICSFLDKYEGLGKQHCFLKAAKPEVSSDGFKVRFPYLKGKTLAEQLGREITEGRAPVAALESAIEKICSVKEGCLIPFTPTKQFGKVFGEFVRIEDNSMTVTNIDALLENILDTEDGWYGIDYEWVYDFPVPLSFVRYRILFYFYRKYYS